MNHHENPNSQTLATLLTFLSGAAVGAVLLALSLPKADHGFRGDLERVGWRIRRKASRLADRAKEAGEDVLEWVKGG